MFISRAQSLWLGVPNLGGFAYQSWDPGHAGCVLGCSSNQEYWDTAGGGSEVKLQAGQWVHSSALSYPMLSLLNIGGKDHLIIIILHAVDQRCSVLPTKAVVVAGFHSNQAEVTPISTCFFIASCTPITHQVCIPFGWNKILQPDWPFAKETEDPCYTLSHMNILKFCTSKKNRPNTVYVPTMKNPRTATAIIATPIYNMFHTDQPFSINFWICLSLLSYSCILPF